MEEIWRDVKEYEGLYQVSNLGRLKNIVRNKIIKLNKRGYNYIGATLCKNAKRKDVYIHQLVAIAFLNHKPCGHKYVIDHINDDTSDNKVENLQIVTQRYNCRKTQGRYSSIYKGVSLCKRDKKWISHIFTNGKKKHLGSFDCELKAYEAYQNALNNL
jgi:hypothetical protein